MSMIETYGDSIRASSSKVNKSYSIAHFQNIILLLKGARILSATDCKVICSREEQSPNADTQK
jgi:hypothetical protein